MKSFKFMIQVQKDDDTSSFYECETIEDVGPKMIDLLSTGAIGAYDDVTVINNETGETIA